MTIEPWLTTSAGNDWNGEDLVFILIFVYLIFFNPYLIFFI